MKWKKKWKWEDCAKVEEKNKPLNCGFSLTRSTPHYVSTSYAMTHLHTYHTYTYVATYIYADATKHSALPQSTWLVCPNQTGRIATAVAFAFFMALSLRDTETSTHLRLAATWWLPLVLLPWQQTETQRLRWGMQMCSSHEGFVIDISSAN